MLEPKVIFEDEYLMVLDKPAGMVVNKAESVGVETVQEWVQGNLKFEISNLKLDDEGEFHERAGIVHRIDKETSGILLVAKTPEAFGKLQEQFAKREVGKKYMALVHGVIADDTGVIDENLGRLPWNRERFGVLEDGREARTDYRVIERFEDETSSEKKRKHPGMDFGYTLIELTPKTGRTHQIRVHMKSIGHPVVADEFYAGRKTARADRVWCPRLFLHAQEIKFRHPANGEMVSFKSELPKDLSDALGKILRA